MKKSVAQNLRDQMLEFCRRNNLKYNKGYYRRLKKDYLTGKIKEQKT